MDQIPQQLVIGLSVGATYALIALGYTMVYGVLKLINFAHGEVYMVGAVSGAALAFLFAPATGEETRRFLKDKAREGRERASEAVEKGRDVVKGSRDVISQAIDRGREVYEQTRRENA